MVQCSSGNAPHGAIARAVLDALSAQIAVLDRDGRIMLTNATWDRFGAENGGRADGGGANYLAVCDAARGACSAEAPEAAAGIRAVLDGRSEGFGLEYPCHGPSEQRWFLMTVRPVRSEALWGAVVMHVDITARRRAEDEAWHMAYHDQLTGLPNRHLFNDRLAQIAAYAHRYGRPAALALIDLDGFKPVNDAHGHPAGDALLVEVAARLRRAVRRSDTVARLGGDEFAVILSDVAHADDATAVVGKALTALRRPMRVAGLTLRVGASAGVAMCPAHGEGPEALVACADAALYRAKAGGRSRCVVYGADPPDPDRERHAA